MTVTDAAADATPEGVGDPILDLLNGFIVQLRRGLPVSLTENLDAMQAIRHVPLEDRETFKYALAATLVKHHNHWKAFETVFEVYFSLRGTSTRSATNWSSCRRWTTTSRATSRAAAISRVVEARTSRPKSWPRCSTSRSCEAISR